MLGLCPSSHRSEEVFRILRLSRVSFLLCSFFAVPVSNTLGFLSLPLRWVFLVFCFYCGSFTELGSCCAWPPPCGGRAEVVSARLNPSHGTIDVRGVCNFLDSVSLKQKFEAMDRRALQLSDGPLFSSMLQLSFI